MQRRTELLKKSDKDGLKSLEKECLANNARFSNWECDRAKMNLTHDRSALYMHCLPADITDVSCKAGEVSAESRILRTAHTQGQPGENRRTSHAVPVQWIDRGRSNLNQHLSVARHGLRHVHELEHICRVVPRKAHGLH